MENRGALRFVAGLCPDNRTVGTKCSVEEPSCTQPRGQCTSSGSLNSTAKPDLPRRAVPPLAQQTRRSESHHRHGSIVGPTGLSHAEVWSQYVDRGRYYERRNANNPIEFLKKKAARLGLQLNTSLSV